MTNDPMQGVNFRTFRTIYFSNFSQYAHHIINTYMRYILLLHTYAPRSMCLHYTMTFNRY